MQIPRCVQNGEYLLRVEHIALHSAGSVDPSVLAMEGPDAVLLQSNSRFVVQPPTLDFVLRDAASHKFAEANELVQHHIAALRSAGAVSAANAPYLDMLAA